MKRSTGLVRAYTTLIRRVSGAVSVCAFVQPNEEREPFLVCDGEPSVPELSSVEAATELVERCAAPVSRVEKIDSAASNSWIIRLPCRPGYAHAAHEKEPTKRRNRRAGDGTPAPDDAVCWIGLRFEDRAPIESRGLVALEGLLRGDFRDLDSRDSVGWTTLFELGGVLAWYAGGLSSILDDPVTGLAGRAEFQTNLEHAMQTARERGRPLSLLFINPDNFTSVNERKGHEAGDRVLREMGERLRTAHRTSDSVAKYGGAIFASFLFDTDRAAAQVVAKKIWSRLTESSYLGGSIRLAVSVGLAVLDPDESELESSLELIRRADTALNAAKRFGGDHVVAWIPELDAKDLGGVDRMTGVYTGNMATDYRNMTLLSDTMTAIASSTNVTELVERVVDRIATTLKADRVGILEWTDDRPFWLKKVAKRSGASGDGFFHDDLELTRSQKELIEEARRQRRPLVKSFSQGSSSKRVLSFAVPLLLKHRVVGGLYLDGGADRLALEGSFDLAFLRAFATQLAVALDRARLGEQQQRRSEEEQLRLRAEVDDLRASLRQTQLVFRSREMDSVMETVQRVAPTKATVLVIGESGTGKELIARTIHELSPFKKKPIVVVDCSAIPVTLMESELFGHERGAYTGAQERRIGRLLEAEGGTVVLDEIGELPLEVQSKLLRFVQERQITPVGGTHTRHVDTRLIAVTNRELMAEAAAGRFREDLYYRLNVVRVSVPPLRERVDDILHLAEHFLDHFARQYQRGALRFDDEARALMVEYPWPGNVRELQHRIMQAVILSEGPVIGVRALELESEGHSPGRAVTVAGDARAVREHDAKARRSEEGLEQGLTFETADACWQALRAALKKQVAAVLDEPKGQLVPLGTWLMEDIVLHAYHAAGRVSGQAHALLGIPETTFRRRLRKVLAQSQAQLLTRRPPWSDLEALLAALVRTPYIGSTDVLHTAREILLDEVVARVEDANLGADLMGVTGRTFRRWTSARSGKELATFVSAS